MGGMGHKKTNKAALALAGVGYIIVTAFTWRDIRRRPSSDIRGDKRVWFVLTALNAGNSVAYWICGRRRRRTPLAS
jgi:hypothetical protein